MIVTLEQELEQERKKFHSGEEIFKHYGIATDEQIDVAWATRVGAGDFISASKLGIKQCFGCDGHGETRNEDGELVARCLVCNGRGWTKTNA